MTLSTRHETITKSSIRQMVEIFYARVRQDSILRPVFEKALSAGWEDHISLITEFWSSMLLGSRSFQGNILATHIALPDVKKDHFARWLFLFKETVLGFYCDDIAKKFLIIGDRIAGRLQLAILHEHTVTLDSLLRISVD